MKCLPLIRCWYSDTFIIHNFFFQYMCFAAPFEVVDGTQMCWWKGSTGVANYYWDGKHEPSEHVCACDAAGDCLNERVKCNCDSSAPQWLSDDGVLTDVDDLPVAELLFGGLEFDGQVAQFQLGPLTCSGRKVIGLAVLQT
jgi:hypothetical protein